jgi:hypothetical protein
MLNDPMFYIVLCVASFGGIAIGYFVSNRQGDSENESYQKGLEEGKKLEAAVSEPKMKNAYSEGLQKGRQEAHSEYHIDITPFYRSEKKGYLAWKFFEVEYGYKYQLLIRGIPCLQPFERIEVTKRESELDEEKLMQLATNIVKSVITSGQPEALAFHFKPAIELLKSG